MPRYSVPRVWSIESPGEFRANSNICYVNLLRGNQPQRHCASRQYPHLLGSPLTQYSGPTASQMLFEIRHQIFPHSGLANGYLTKTTLMLSNRRSLVPADVVDDRERTTDAPLTLTAHRSLPGPTSGVCHGRTALSTKTSGFMVRLKTQTPCRAR